MECPFCSSTDIQSHAVVRAEGELHRDGTPVFFNRKHNNLDSEKYESLFYTRISLG